MANFTTVFTGKVTAFRPTEEEIANLKVGDLAPDAFGSMQPVTRIYARTRDIYSRLFVCYYVRFGERAEMSNSMKTGEMVRTVSLCNAHTSAEIDRFDLR